ncbi:MAG TPA: hypothetical protein VEF53_08525 [Patescibacteria group bacterium]|nr:hypothetical protein [Patescibacteria group bacterium]
MPVYPFFCPYMNQQNEDYDDEDFRTPNGFGPPFGPPSGGPGQGGPPGPPPSIAPTQKATFGGPSIKAVDPGAIRPCRYQFIYIWPSYGRPFWAWLTFVGRRSVAGYRWTGNRWRYFGMDLRQIDSFQCY